MYRLDASSRKRLVKRIEFFLRHVRQVQEYVHPNGEHLIDCFQSTMPLTVRRQPTKAQQGEPRRVDNHGLERMRPSWSSL
jgi:hypothetical protein